MKTINVFKDRVLLDCFMSRVNGSWSPSQTNLSKANVVLEATTSSGKLYRDGLGMIASENIVSPMVQKIVASDLHGRYAEGLPGKRLSKLYRFRYYRKSRNQTC